MSKETYTINAEAQALGRIASQAAIFLMGKNSLSFKKNEVASVEVKIINASKIKLSSKKLKDKKYLRYSGYPGGLKSENMDKLIEKKGYEEIFKKAIKGMLPNNKLRDKTLKNLIIVD